MAIPAADTYAAASGATLRAGRFAARLTGGVTLADLVAAGDAGVGISALSGGITLAEIAAAGTMAGLPSWVPAAGTFANVGTSTLYAARPTGWPTSESAGPYGNWSGAVWAPDFGAQGGYVLHGSGHLPAGNPTWAGVWVWDVATATWMGRNVPANALVEPVALAGYNGYFESTDTATLGHTYPPHTYDGLVYQSAANGGGSDGSLIRNFYAGSGITNARAIHSFDLSSATAAPTRRVDDVTMAGASSSYPMAALDEARGGYWLLTYNGQGPLKFVSFADWSITNYSGKEFNDYGDQHLIYLPPPYDAIVSMGRTDAGAINQSLRVSQITSDIPGSFISRTPSGTAPVVTGSAKAGGVWSTLLSCIVQYTGRGGYTVHKLTPPAPGSLTSGTWTWDSETLTGAGGATPANRGSDDSGSYSRFVEAPEFNCFLWSDGINNIMQAWRLTGM